MAPEYNYRSLFSGSSSVFLLLVLLFFHSGFLLKIPRLRGESLLLSPLVLADY